MTRTFLTLPAGSYDSARSYAAASKAPETKRAYAREWASFVSWCETSGAGSLPCSPDVHGETIEGEGMGGSRVGMGLDSGMGSPHPPLARRDRREHVL